MTEKELIKKLGGVTAVARFLNKSPQCVCNWTKKNRKIPAQVKLDYPDLFLNDNPPNLKLLENQ